MRTLIIFLCFINFSYAQKNQCRISGLLSPQLVKNLSPSNQILKRFYEPKDFNYKTGLHLSYYFSNYRLSPEISVLWNSIGYRSQAYSGNDEPQVVDFNSKYIEIPLGVGFRVINKVRFNLDISLGASYGWLFNSNEKVSCNYQCDSSKSYSNKTIFSTYTGLKTSFLFKNKMFVSTQILLSSLNKGFDHVVPNKTLTYLLNIGLGYTF